MELMSCKDNLAKFLEKYDDIYWSLKLDGVRCCAFVNKTNREVIYQSRNGKYFKNFDCFNESLLALAENFEDDEVCFDGEVTSLSFDNLMTQVHRKYDVDNSDLAFYVFDYVSNSSQFDRYEYLVDAYNYIGIEAPLIRILPHNVLSDLLKNEAGVHRLMDNAVKEGYEGLVLKAMNVPYQHKRSDAWCKVKPFYTADIEVVDIQPGTGKHEGRMGALICEYPLSSGKSKRVKVGTGFTDDEREQDYIGLLIEVRYQEVTKAGSLRFPSFVRIRDDKDEATVIEVK
jgi:DNA ligase-1